MRSQSLALARALASADRSPIGTSSSSFSFPDSFKERGHAFFLSSLQPSSIGFWHLEAWGLGCHSNLLLDDPKDLPWQGGGGLQVRPGKIQEILERGLIPMPVGHGLLYKLMTLL